MKQEPAIQLFNLTKNFSLSLWKSKLGVSDLSLQIPRGQIVGLLGPNGSGKSTTLKMILGFLKPTSGQILVCGEDVGSRSSRRQVGYLPENPRFPKFLTARELLSYYGGLQGLGGTELVAKSDEMLEWVGLTNAADERLLGFSKGMTQRLAIAQALIHGPSVLILDEPMSGLDPLGRVEIRRLVASIHERLPQTTIFFSSHILDDVEQLCQWVAVLHQGKLKRYCTTTELMGSELQRFSVTVATQKENLGDWASTSIDSPLGPTVRVDGPDKLAQLLRAMQDRQLPIVSVNARRQGLETALFKEVTP